MANYRFTASTWRRLPAHFVDQLIVGIIYAPVWMQVGSSWINNSVYEVSWRWVLACFAFQFAYRWLFISYLGATIGKMIFGLRVVNFHNGEEISLFQGFLRVLADHFSLLFGNAFKIFAYFRFDRRHLSDWIAETQVRQSQPREKPAFRHPILGSILVVLFVCLEFLSTYQFVQKVEFEKDMIRLHPEVLEQDSVGFE